LGTGSPTRLSGAPTLRGVLRPPIARRRMERVRRAVGDFHLSIAHAMADESNQRGMARLSARICGGGLRPCIGACGPCKRSRPEISLRAELRRRMEGIWGVACVRLVPIASSRAGAGNRATEKCGIVRRRRACDFPRQTLCTRRRRVSASTPLVSWSPGTTIKYLFESSSFDSDGFQRMCNLVALTSRARRTRSRNPAPK
jgi:hypothetical protein